MTAGGSSISVCPCCGGNLSAISVLWNAEARTVIWEGRGAQLSPKQALIFDELWKARASGRLLSNRVLVDRAYAGEIDGGPLAGDDCARAFIHQIRTLLAEAPIAIERGRSIGYRIVNRKAIA